MRRLSFRTSGGLPDLTGSHLGHILMASSLSMPELVVSTHRSAFNPSARSCSPATGVALRMEAGNYYNAPFFHFEEYAVREPPHSRAPASVVHPRKSHGILQSLPPSLLLRARTEARDQDASPRTTPLHRAGLRSPPGARQPAVSPWLKEFGFDLFPRNNIRGVLRIPRKAGVEFRALFVREVRCAGF